MGTFTEIGLLSAEHDFEQAASEIGRTLSHSHCISAEGSHHALETKPCGRLLSSAGRRRCSWP
jgi:hypothetical protein